MVFFCFILFEKKGGEWDQSVLTCNICNLLYSFLGGGGQNWNHPGFVFTVL